MRYLKGYMMRFTLSFLTLLLLASTAFGALVAEPATVTMPDGQVIQMWGFRDPTDGSHAPGEWKIPTITAVEGTSLTIDLTNNIQVAGPGLIDGVSVIIPGQKATEPNAMAPEFFTDSDGDQRVSSFTRSAPYLATESYTWGSLRAGTYLIQSGTHAAVQMQMGLYAILKVTTAAGEAYAGVPYDNDVTLLYSEIDPLVHEAVYTGAYGDPAAVVPSTGLPMTSTMEYSPVYHLINGQPYVPGDAPYAAGATGNRVLLRFLNAGLKNRVPVVQGSYMTILAEDGYRKAYDLQQYSVFLSPGKTFDAYIPSLPAGPLPLYDRRLSFENFSGAGSGMLAYLNSAPSTPLTLISPNGGEQIPLESIFLIRWSPVDGAVNYRLDYFDADGTPHRIAQNTGNVTGYAWTVRPNVVTEVGKTVRVRAYNASGVRVGLDDSDGTFAVTPALNYGAVLSPNGGEILSPRGSYLVQWVGHPEAVNYRLDYFDADGTPHRIAQNTGNVTGYNWTVLNGAIREPGKIVRVRGYNAAGNLVSRDDSDGTFSILDFGTLLAPNSGETLQVGNSYTIQWVAHPNAVNYRLDYFDADGTPHRIAQDTGNVTSYNWLVPVGVDGVGKTAQVRAYNADGVLVSRDGSDGTFDIIP